MGGALSRWVLVLVLAGVGGVLLFRAVAQDAGPLFYFGSAVFFGMAFGALQAARRPPER